MLLVVFLLVLAQMQTELAVQPVEILVIEALLRSLLVVATHFYQSLLLVSRLENHQKHPLLSAVLLRLAFVAHQVLQSLPVELL